MVRLAEWGKRGSLVYVDGCHDDRAELRAEQNDVILFSQPWEREQNSRFLRSMYQPLGLHHLLVMKQTPPFTLVS